MTSASQTKALLVKEFDARNVDASLEHFSAAIQRFSIRDWDGVALKAGKFVESVTKALMIHCGKTVGTPRQLKVGHELRQLEHVSGTTYSDTVRIVIPKACIFVYEVVNNRGGRHDAHDIDANEMDATVVVPVVSWVLSEMVRFCGKTDTVAAAALIDELTNKTYPYFENIDGRAYVNIKSLKPGEIALLLLYSLYPKRINRQDLVGLVQRHGVVHSAANTAVHRLKQLIGDDNGNWKLRGLGRQEAEVALRKMPHKH